MWWQWTFLSIKLFLYIFSCFYRLSAWNQITGLKGMNIFGLLMQMLQLLLSLFPGVRNWSSEIEITCPNSYSSPEARPGQKHRAGWSMLCDLCSTTQHRREGCGCPAKCLVTTLMRTHTLGEIKYRAKARAWKNQPRDWDTWVLLGALVLNLSPWASACGLSFHPARGKGAWVASNTLPLCPDALLQKQTQKHCGFVFA